MFDTDNPPKSYEKFKKQVLRGIEDADLEGEENFPAALFLVNRKNEAKIIYVDALIEEIEEDPEEFLEAFELSEEEVEDFEISLQFIVNGVLPNRIKSFGSKYFCMVFGAIKTTQDEEAEKIVVALMGWLNETEVFFANVFKENGQLQTSMWKEDNVYDYEELAMNFRRAITYQG